MDEERSIKEQLSALEGWAIEARQEFSEGNFAEVNELLVKIYNQSRRRLWRKLRTIQKKFPLVEELIRKLVEIEAAVKQGRKGIKEKDNKGVENSLDIILPDIASAIALAEKIKIDRLERQTKAPVKRKLARRLIPLAAVIAAACGTTKQVVTDDLDRSPPPIVMVKSDIPKYRSLIKDQRPFGRFWRLFNDCNQKAGDVSHAWDRLAEYLDIDIERRLFRGFMATLDRDSLESRFLYLKRKLTTLDLYLKPLSEMGFAATAAELRRSSASTNVKKWQRRLNSIVKGTIMVSEQKKARNELSEEDLTSTITELKGSLQLFVNTFIELGISTPKFEEGIAKLIEKLDKFLQSLK